MEVKINIHTIQYNEYGEKNDIIAKATGTLHEKRDNIYVIYKEKEEGKETTTSIKIENDKVTIKRFGEITKKNPNVIYQKIFKGNYVDNNYYIMGSWIVGDKFSGMFVKQSNTMINEYSCNVIPVRILL